MRKHPKNRYDRPNLETLEERCTPAASANAVAAYVEYDGAGVLASEGTFTLDQDGGAHQYDAATDTTTALDGPAAWASIAATTGADGSAVLYAVSQADGSLWEFWEGFGDAPGPDANWRQISADSFSEISATSDVATGGGAIQQTVYGIKSDGTLWQHNDDLDATPDNEGDLEANWVQLGEEIYQHIAAAKVVLPDLTPATVDLLPAESVVFGIRADGTLWEHDGADWAQLSTGQFLDIAAVIDLDVTAGPDPADDAITGTHPVVYGIIAGTNDLWMHSSDFDGLPEGTTDANWRWLSTGDFSEISATIDITAEDATGSPALQANPVLFATDLTFSNLWSHNELHDAVIGNLGSVNANWALVSTGNIVEFDATYSDRFDVGFGDPVAFAIAGDANLWQHLVGVGFLAPERAPDFNWAQRTTAPPMAGDPLTAPEPEPEPVPDAADVDGEDLIVTL